MNDVGVIKDFKLNVDGFKILLQKILDSGKSRLRFCQITADMMMKDFPVNFLQICIFLGDFSYHVD